MAIVSYDRVPGYPQERITKTDIQVTDKLQCAWEERIMLAKELLGYIAGGTVYPPQEYDFGDEPIRNVYCRDVAIDPLLGIEAGEYTKALLTVTYANRSYDEPDSGETTYISESIEPASVFMTLDKGGLYWDAGQTTPIKDMEAPQKIIRMGDWIYTKHFAPSIPSWIWTHPGTINAATVKSKELAKTFLKETLLCGNPTLSREITSEGATKWSVTVRITYNPNTWNKFPRASADGALAFSTIYDGAGAAKTFYDTSDFGDIVVI